MGRWAVAAGCALLMTVSGCGLDPQYRAARDARNEARQDSQCRGYGAKPGSDVYVQCRMMIAEQNRQSAEASGAAMRAAGMALMNPPQQQRQTLNCTSYRTGMYTNTNCF